MSLKGINDGGWDYYFVGTLELGYILGVFGYRFDMFEVESFGHLLITANN